MKKKTRHNLSLLVLLAAFFVVLGIEKLEEAGTLSRLNKHTTESNGYRQHKISEKMVTYLQEVKERGRDVGLYLLESNFGQQAFPYAYEESTFQSLKKKWKKKNEWGEYLSANQALWDDIKYFPIPLSTTDKKLKVSYEDSWQTKRTYGGERGHEGCDIMTRQNVSGVYPVVSMTDGVVTNIGWLDKGGYRIGITSSSGGYFYYAHLSSYGNVKKGDQVQAGEVLGFVGDTGYGPEGTTGKFPVHLHLGIYLYPDGEEMSVNPYWVLRFLESYKLKYAYSLQEKVEL